jgi:hypothetical protein
MPDSLRKLSIQETIQILFNQDTCYAPFKIHCNHCFFFSTKDPKHSCRFKGNIIEEIKKYKPLFMLYSLEKSL